MFSCPPALAWGMLLWSSNVERFNIATTNSPGAYGWVDAGHSMLTFKQKGGALLRP